MTRALWTSIDAARATKGEAEGQAWMASGVAIDSRELTVGDLFVALEAARDGHDFVKAAFDEGAAAALVSRSVDGLPEDAPLLRVSDTLSGLRDLAVAARERSAATRVGITGSVGKTTTKALLAAALQEFGDVHAADRSFNNHWGVPLTLARMAVDTTFGVFEMGMNARGEIRDLSDLVKPKAALITAIAPAHLEALGSLRAIAEAKAEIFEGLVPYGLAVIPHACDHHDVLRAASRTAGARLITFGVDDGAAVRLAKSEIQGDAQRVTAFVEERMVSFALRLQGAHNALNACAALAAVHGLGLNVDEAAAAMGSVAPPMGRGVTAMVPWKGGAVMLIDDTYNANPASMRAALGLLADAAPGAGGRRVAVLGDMAELGVDAKAHHEALKDAACAADRVHGAGPLMAALGDHLAGRRRGGFAQDAAALVDHVLDDLRSGDVVLVKGSRSSAMERIVDAIRAAASHGVER